MYDRFDEEQMEYVEERQKPNIWSVREGGFLTNGLSYKPEVIGYVVCNNNFISEYDTIKIPF